MCATPAVRGTTAYIPSHYMGVHAFDFGSRKTGWYARTDNALDQRGFTGSIAYEMCSPLRDGGAEATLDHYASRFLEWLGNFRRLCENQNVQTAGRQA